MVKGSLKDLLKDERIHKSVNNSVFYGLDQICEYAIKAEKPFEFIAKSLVTNVFPFYSTSKSHPLEIEPKPVPALEQFWREVSLISCYEFGELEKYVLSTDSGAVSIFLTRLMLAAEKADKSSLSRSYLEPVYQAIKEETFGYTTFDEMVKAQKRKKS